MNIYNKTIGKLFSNGEDIFVQLIDGSVFCKNEQILKFPSYCDEIYTLKINKKDEIIGLSDNSLYFGEKLFCTGCTSLLVDANFLFFTKKNAPFDILFLFHSSNLPWLGILPEPNLEHFYSRNIEKSSTIVCLSKSSLVLQHSRGNLETIAPRLLMLYKIKDLIHEKQYFSAFKLLRQHKIDLNLLCDIEYTSFDVKLFFNQIQKQEFLNLFLTSLNDFDSVAKYFHSSPNDFSGKTNKISDLLRKELNPAIHPLSILTSFVVKKPSEIDQALTWVQELKKNTKPKPQRPPHETEAVYENKVYAEDVIKYLSWLVNPEKLYNVALSMYDLELASDLAKYTQKDPKEYLPYLQNLNQLDPVLMKYQINIDLKNYPKALKALVDGGEKYRAQSIGIIKDHKLFMQALELLNGEDILEAVAESLVKLDHPFQAAAMFEACRNYEKAKNLYLQCEEWDLACKMGEFLGQDLKENISNRCAELGRFENAANMLKNNSEENLKIKYWVQAGKYKQAALVAITIEGKMLLKGTLKNYANDMWDDINKNIKTWKEKKTRLVLVQQNKNLMPESHKILNDEVASQYSVDSSMSKATQFTKKQRKKVKKIRKASAKEGSQYEEDYLVDLLVTLRPDLSHIEKVEGLCIGLILVGDFITAHKLWYKLDELKTITYAPISTLKQQEFIKKFYETFPEINKNDENQSKLLDMHSTSTFLADGLASHKIPVFNSKLQSFFKSLSS